MIKTIKAKNSKTHTNGIYDADGTSPSIHAIPKQGFHYIVLPQDIEEL